LVPHYDQTKSLLNSQPHFCAIGADGEQKTISTAQANQGFSRLLREVQHGEDSVVLSRGRAVACPIPYSESYSSAKLVQVMERLKQLPVRQLDNWSRDDLYQ
jgi:antitoxin (DNA-binding transcriptional repressor) of toxin-antitoxin stability system